MKYLILISTLFFSFSASALYIPCEERDCYLQIESDDRNRCVLSFKVPDSFEPASHQRTIILFGNNLYWTGFMNSRSSGSTKYLYFERFRQNRNILRRILSSDIVKIRVGNYMNTFYIRDYQCEISELKCRL